MKLLDKFEHSIERLMEGTTSGLLRQTLQPAEIGKKLERAMLAQKRASIGTSLVPNIYHVRLHPRDFAQFEDYAQGLSRQMEAWLAQVATQKNLSVIDRIRVTIGSDENVKRRNPAVDAQIADSRGAKPGRQHASIVDRAPVSPAQATSVFNIARPTSGSFTLSVTSGSLAGTTFRIQEGSSTVGRSHNNTYVLDAPDVSRRHARFEHSSGRLRIYDLNSTNGTRVNGETIRVSDLEPADVVTIGGLNLNVTGAGDDRSGYR